MELGLDEIICPYCGHTKEIENELDEGLFLVEDYQCEDCYKRFILESDVYTITYSFESWTMEEYEDMLNEEEERLKRVRAHMKAYWKEMEDNE